MARGRRVSRARPAQPQRRCVGCRKSSPQAELLRIVAEDGKAAVGRAKEGRGCYLCHDRRCAERAVKTGQIGRALRGRAGNPELSVVMGWLLDAQKSAV